MAWKKNMTIREVKSFMNKKKIQVAAKKLSSATDFGYSVAYDIIINTLYNCSFIGTDKAGQESNKILRNPPTEKT